MVYNDPYGIIFHLGVVRGQFIGEGHEMTRYFPYIVFFFAFLAGCATTPVVMQEGALPPTPLSSLIANADSYKGRTVVLGGYVLEVENQENQTRILAVGVQIDSRQRPESKDLSEGRLVVICDGFIDPEVYRKDRAVTVYGEILGGGTGDAEIPYPYLRIKMRDMYLWPESELFETGRSPEYFPFYPYPWYWRYPYWDYPYYWGSYWVPYRYPYLHYRHWKR